MKFAKKDILDMESRSVGEIQCILDTAETLKEISTRPIKKVPTPRGKTIIHFFHEPSTGTRTSFKIAAKRLRADTVSISASISSIVIGDIAHSHVARCDTVGFIKMGAKVILAGPPTMMPIGVETLGALVRYHVQEAIKDTDVLWYCVFRKSASRCL